MSRIKKIITKKKVHTKLGSTKIIFIDRCDLIFRELFYIILRNHQYKQKSWKKVPTQEKKRLYIYNFIEFEPTAQSCFQN